jgi:dipeptidyl aminopeptidase/acylaminoacyl peptidase
VFFSAEVTTQTEPSPQAPYAIFRVPFTGGRTEDVVGQLVDPGFALSPDGKQLAFSRRDTLYLLDTRDGTTSSVGAFGIDRGRSEFSPDPSQLVILTHALVEVVDISIGTVHRVYDVTWGNVVDSTLGLPIAFRWDGSALRILHYREIDDPHRAGTLDVPFELDVETGNDRWIWNVPHGTRVKGWTEDGALLAFSKLVCVESTPSYCTRQESMTHIFHVATQSTVYETVGDAVGLTASPDGALIALGAGKDLHILPRP